VCTHFTSRASQNNKQRKAAAMTLREILHSKGHVVHTIGLTATLEDVVQRLVGHNCGSLVVCDADQPSGRMVGIITERDILRAVAMHKGSLSKVGIADAMTRDVTIGAPTDSVEDTMGLMTQLRIRHLPVVEDGQLLGLVSIGDVVKMQHDRLTMENHYLKSYIQG
jgi:CBS domain-containing protein